MAVELAPVALAEKAELRAALDPYLIWHADLVDPDRVHGDPTVYAYFDLYWTEPARIPLWILADGARAGFMLLNRYSPSGQGVDRAISEFCVLAEYRRRGIGHGAVALALSTTRGWWELQVFHANTEGMAFWPHAVTAARPAEHAAMEQDDRVIHRFRMA